MKKILLLFLLTVYYTIEAQINLTGTADYQFTITGYQGKDRKACGDIFGLRNINIFYENGHVENIWSGRIWNQNFTFTKNYNKNQKIKGVQIHSINRWKTWGSCTGGPRNNYSRVLPVNSTCFSQFHGNPVHVTENVTVKSNPIYHLKFDQNKQYILEDNKKLNITLPDNLNSSDYVWKYSINGISSIFPDEYNYTSILDIPAEKFISEIDYGKIISIWIESSCNMNGNIQKSNIFNFIVLKPAPKILSHRITEPACFDDKGTVTFTFDRTLLPDEEANFILNGEYLQDINPTLNQNLVNQLRTSTSVTLPNAEHGTHTLKIVGTYKGNPTYSGKEQIREFTITPPTPVTFSVTSSKNVYCHGGNDGNIQLSASGGLGDFQYTLDNGNTWINFTEPNNTTITNLDAKTYTLKVRDKNLCIAKENGKEKQISVEIKQPNAPIFIENIEINEPKGYGLYNGNITVTVKGGTPKIDGSYHYEWRKDSPNGTMLTNVETSPDTTNGFSFNLKDIPAGKYYLTIKDNLYDNANTSLETCGIISQEIIVSQPDPLITKIEVKKKISCHIDNNYPYKLDLNANNIPDEAEDGILQSATTGGVPPYSYQWQKETNGVFQDISGAINIDLTNLSIGKYKILITDVNGNTAQADYTLGYPDELKVELKANHLLCYGADNATAEVFVSGGTGNYSYRWNNLDKTARIQNLSAGNYFVLVTDENQCKVNGNIEIKQPDEIIITDLLIKDPLSPQAANGQIHIALTGGIAPYHISWSNGMTGEHITGLREGTYTAYIRDANGCLITKSYTLTDPERLPLDLGEDIVTLCLGDTKTYNVKINDPSAIYTWTDTYGNIISNAPEITLSTAGIYTITIVNAQGNTASDSVEIRLSSEVLDPQFLITTHAYIEAPVKLVNTSKVAPQKVEWIIPQNQGIKILSQSDEYLEVLFANTGSYIFGLKGTQGACEKIFYKNIVVEENTTGVNLNPQRISNIKEFSIAPNPNQGQFKVIIKLHQPESIKIRLIDMVSHEVITPIIKPKATEFEIPLHLNIASSTYFIILETVEEAQMKKLLIVQ